MPDDLIGPYRLIARLGRGGMAEVYEAVDTSFADGPRVAVKLLSVAAARDPELLERFRRESRLAAQVRHPHVLPILGHGEIDGRPYIVMRLVEGTDFATEIRRGAVTIERAVSIVEQIAAALDATHEIGLRHRDVKPSNVLLEHDVRNGTDHAYLIDWGIAQPIDTSGAPPVTRIGHVVGTPQYIAPERLTAGSGSDHRADVYSLAVILYECLAGRPPFVDDEQHAILAAHVEDNPPALPTTVPAALRTVVVKGLAKDPDQRYQSAGDFAAAAHAALGTAKGHTFPYTAPDDDYLYFDSYPSDINLSDISIPLRNPARPPEMDPLRSPAGTGPWSGPISLSVGGGIGAIAGLVPFLHGDIEGWSVFVVMALLAVAGALLLWGVSQLFAHSRPHQQNLGPADTTRLDDPERLPSQRP